MAEYHHIPVMLKESIEMLAPKKGGVYVDCTLGGGGYSFALAKMIGDKGLVIAFDMDELAIVNAKKRMKEEGVNNILVVNGNFRDLESVVEGLSFKGKLIKEVDGVVMDLGLSTAHLEDRERGISFGNADAPLKMAFGEGFFDVDADTIVNKWREPDIYRILKEYGEERFAGNIVHHIADRRKHKKIETVGDLLFVIERAIPKKFQHSKIHLATKTFQALRIAVNEELESLQAVLPQAAKLLKSGGRMVVVSYHSLEDRIVKHFFKEMSREDDDEDIAATLRLVTKKPMVPGDEELQANPRSRSAKLRVAEKI